MSLEKLHKNKVQSSILTVLFLYVPVEETYL